MKIRCISRTTENFPPSLIRQELGLHKGRNFAVIPGKEYIVYAMTMYYGSLWYYICDEEYTYYPIWNPCHLFTLTDARIPSCWTLGFRPSSKPDIPDEPVFAFPEWSSDPLYYDRLTEGNESAIQVFRKYKTLMDEELPE